MLTSCIENSNGMLPGWRPLRVIQVSRCAGHYNLTTNTFDAIQVLTLQWRISMHKKWQRRAKHRMINGFIPFQTRHLRNLGFSFKLQMWLSCFCYRQSKHKIGYHQYQVFYSGSCNNFRHSFCWLLLELLLELLLLLLLLLLPLMLLPRRRLQKRKQSTRSNSSSICVWIIIFFDPDWQIKDWRQNLQKAGTSNKRRSPCAMVSMTGTTLGPISHVAVNTARYSPPQWQLQLVKSSKPSRHGHFECHSCYSCCNFQKIYAERLLDQFLSVPHCYLLAVLGTTHASDKLCPNNLSALRVFRRILVIVWSFRIVLADCF